MYNYQNIIKFVAKAMQDNISLLLVFILYIFLKTGKLPYLLLVTGSLQHIFQTMFKEKELLHFDNYIFASGSDTFRKEVNSDYRDPTSMNGNRLQPIFQFIVNEEYLEKCLPLSYFYFFLILIDNMQNLKQISVLYFKELSDVSRHNVVDTSEHWD